MATTLTRTDTAQTLTLPTGLMWADEFGWSAPQTRADYSVTGALLLQSAARQAGRFITLESAAPDMGWARRSAVLTLRAWAALPITATGGRFNLALDDGRSFAVVWRHADGALEAQPVLGLPPGTDDDYYTIRLRLMEV